MENFLYKVLDVPFVYKIAQWIFAGGGDKRIIEEINFLRRQLPRGKKILDVGCGPQSLLWCAGLNPIGLDITPSYVKEYKKHGYDARVGNAQNLPFADSSFNGVWSLGVFHHLDEKRAKTSILEMMRVTKKGGYIAIIDAVLPVNVLTGPIAQILQKLDRGKFVRTEKENRQLLPSDSIWKTNRFTYTVFGLECWSAYSIKH